MGIDKYASAQTLSTGNIYLNIEKEVLRRTVTGAFFAFLLTACPLPSGDGIK
jgi:hypothetical protein